VRVLEGSFVRGRAGNKEGVVEKAQASQERKDRIKRSKHDRPIQRESQLSRMTRGPNFLGKYYLSDRKKK
jgi:hypothetical protein